MKKNILMKTAVIYARVSSAGDRQNTERQVYDLRAYANRNELQILKTFEEYISGAKRQLERPVLQDCLEYCKNEGIDIILVSELSRIGRNVLGVFETVKFCIDSGINIYFQKEGLSLFQSDGSQNPFLHIFISVLGTCAELERENIQFRLNSGRQRYIETGGKLGRKVGYRKSKDQLIEDYKIPLKYLRKGFSVRKVAKICDISPSTAMKLKREFNL